MLRKDVREVILNAVDRLLARYGYQKMTMDDIAREAGISKRTIYLNFANKEEVALSSIDRVASRLQTQLTTIVQTMDTPDAKLRQMLVTRVLFRFDSVQAYYQSFDDLFAALRPAYLARRERYFAMEADLLMQVLDEGRQGGVLVVKDTLVTAQTMLLATNSLLPYSLSLRELGARDEIARKVGALADLLLDGVRRTPLASESSSGS
ncbi:MAG TPA: TetR/AcrR family transcriptional regulator [Chthonomonadaceae bacterium]|nr:TetR/AcrR family transcriptional regulator [Chthonomonadaceae bacterium]